MKKFIFRPKLILILLIAVIIWVLYVGSFIEIIYPPGAANPCPGCPNVSIGIPEYIRYHEALPPWVHDKRAYYHINFINFVRPTIIFFPLFYAEVLLFLYLLKPIKKINIILVIANKILVAGAILMLVILFLYFSGFIGLAL